MPTSTTKTTEVDVLIIGAGPAGLMACNALAKAGINVRIVDKRPVKLTTGHAAGIQPRIIEVFESYGLARRLLDEATQLHVTAFYNPNPITGGIELTERIPDVSETSTPYPFEAALHQGAIEDIFIDSMKESGVKVDRPVIPVSIQISESEKRSTDLDAHPVRVVLKNLAALEGQADTEVVYAKYVLGGDGAHSWVRKAFDISMEGEQTDFVWGVVDMIPDTDFPDIRNKCAIHSNHGSCMVIPREGDMVRLYAQLGSNDTVNATNGRVDKDQIGPEKVLEVARRSMAPYTIGTPKAIDWWTIYRIGQRVAARYSVDERVFIAGDACHTHSPKAGQGMNASMNDSHNLAWKLIHVMRGWANPSILKTYELERRRFAVDLINFDKQYAKMFSGRVKTSQTQDGISPEEFKRVFQSFGGLTSGAGLCYQESLIVNAQHQLQAAKFIIGKRVPSQIVMRADDSRSFELQHLIRSDTRFKVLVFTGDIYDRAQKAKLNESAEEMSADGGFLKRYSSGVDPAQAFDVLAIVSKSDIVRHYDLPEILKLHWTKVYVDNKELRGTRGGDTYDNFGIDATGAIVIVRPDGYVGTIAPLDSVADLNAYFAQIGK